MVNDLLSEVEDVKLIDKPRHESYHLIQSLELEGRVICSIRLTGLKSDLRKLPDVAEASSKSGSGCVLEEVVEFVSDMGVAAAAVNGINRSYADNFLLRRAYRF